MRRIYVSVALLGLLAAQSAVAEVVILDEDFSTWTPGTIDGSYALPAGWSLVTAGMVISPENAVLGTQTLKSTDGLASAIRFSWTPVDPTTANPLKIVIYMRLDSDAKVEKGAVLLNANTATGGCDPAVYWYELPSSPIGSRVYRVRDRANCTVGTPSSPAVYTTATTFSYNSNDLRTWVRWEIVCTDSGAELFKDGVSQGLFGGAPFASLDNFVGLDLGGPEENWWDSDLGPNGDIWFDKVQIIQGPFGPTPTPTETPVPTATATPLSSAGRIVWEDFEGAEWPVGTINAYYPLPGGWSSIADGMQITTARDHTTGTGKSLTNGSDSDACVRLTWTAQDPTQDNPFVVSYWGYKGGGKMENGVTLLNRYGLAGCAPMVYWHTNTLNENLTRVRDRENCDGAPYGSVYGASETRIEIAQDSGAWHEWKVIATDAGGETFKDGISLGTFAGAPNADMDQFKAMEFGRPQSHAWGDYGGNGTMWFDDIYLAVGGAVTGVKPTDWASY